MADRQELYHVGDRVKIYFPGNVIRGAVIGEQWVSVVGTSQKCLCATLAYLVELDVHVDEERMYIVTTPFMARDKSKR